MDAVTLAAAAAAAKKQFVPRDAPRNLIGQSLEFGRVNGGAAILSQATQSLAAGATAAPSIYWPWIIDARATLGATALDEFYLYYSTDHENTHPNSGIWLATAPTELGPWTVRGRVYRDDSSGLQTETPTVFRDPTGSTALVMLYQQATVTGAVGSQSTCYATSNDGVTWTRGGIAIDIPTTWPSDGHTGYARLTRIGDLLVSHHLAGGGDVPTFGMSSSVDGRTWSLSPDPLHYGLGQVGTGRRIEWNSGDVIEWRGQRWWIGLLADFTSGSAPKDARIAVAPISADLRRLLGAPRVQLYPTTGAETTNYRSLRTFVARDGRVILYYQSGQAFYAAVAKGAAA